MGEDMDVTGGGSGPQSAVEALRPGRRFGSSVGARVERKVEAIVAAAESEAISIRAAAEADAAADREAAQADAREILTQAESEAGRILKEAFDRRREAERRPASVPGGSSLRLRRRPVAVRVRRVSSGQVATVSAIVTLSLLLGALVARL
jgi:hypothetical protein